MSQTAIPCVLMRGGTSKGPYFRLADLPADPAVRDAVLLAVMGSPDLRQIDGIGGADTLTSKVAMVSPSARDDADVDFLFAQVSVDQAIVDTAPSCGNILSGVAPYAIETGMVAAQPDLTEVRVYNINTQALIEIRVLTPGGEVEYAGDTAIDGVPGTAAPVLCKYMNVVGSKTSGLLPTGQAIDEIEGVAVSCVDVAMPLVFMPADAFGIGGGESRDELNADRALLERIESVRLQAGRLMGLGDVQGSVVPKVGLLSRPERGGHIRSRYFTPLTCHAAHAVTGGICLATACLVPGTVAAELAAPVAAGAQGEWLERTLVIEHPSGKLDIELGYRYTEQGFEFGFGGVVRTARRLFDGCVYIPSSVWDGKNGAAAKAE